MSDERPVGVSETEWQRQKRMAEQRSEELETLKREPTCALCLQRRPTKRHHARDYCVDCYPEAAGEWGLLTFTKRRKT